MTIEIAKRPSHRRNAEETTGRKCRRAWANYGTSGPAWVARLATIEPRHFMTQRDRAVFDALPERFTVYRAQDPTQATGISWTKHRKIAEEFIDLCKSQNRILLIRVVTKAEIYAAIAGREHEILILPDLSELPRS